MTWDSQAIPYIAGLALLEGLAVPRPRFSASPVLVIAAFYHSHLGPPVALICLLLMLALSLLRTGLAQARECLAPFLALALAAVPAWLLPGPLASFAGAALVYALVARHLAGNGPTVGLPPLALALLGLALSTLAPWHLAWYLPVLLLCHHQAHGDALRLAIQVRKEEQQRSRQTLEQLRQSQAQVSTQEAELALLSGRAQEQEAWLKRLRFLLEAARILGAVREPGALWDRFRQLCGEAVPHRSGALFVMRQAPVVWGMPADVPGERLQRLVPQGRQGELVDNLGERAPIEGLRSMVAFPLVDEEGWLGTVMLFSDEGNAYGREHLDVLRLLGMQLAVSLRSCGLQNALNASQAQLAQSNKLAAVGQLAAGIAHELNSPLAAAMIQIGQATRTLERDPEAVGPKLDKARLALTQARAIIDKLLVYAREGSDAGYRQVNLADVVHDTLELYQNQIEENGVRLEIESAPAWVHGNPNELQQVLLNLLFNARDAVHDSADRTIHVRLQTRDGTARCGVRDHGPGVPAELQERIFEPFFTTKEVGRGTGLGLAVARQIVKQHGGKLGVESRPDQGCLFLMSFPAAEEAHSLGQDRD